MKKYKFLITGANGQIGKGLIPSLIQKHGLSSVIATDVSDSCSIQNCNYEQLDVRNKEKYEYLVKHNNVNYVLHLAGIISALGERNPQLAKEVNIDSVFTTFELAKKYSLQLFIPSTIAVYGGDYNRFNVSPDLKPVPSTLYGCTKILMENLGYYYKTNFGLDFRCIRYTGVVSPFEYAYNGSAYYATEIFYKAVREGKYSINLSKDRRIPLCHLDDIITGTIKYIEAPKERLNRTVYNIHGLDFTPEEIVNEIKKHLTKFEAVYEPKIQDTIAATWPSSLNDIEARSDWGWNPDYSSIDKLVRDMLEVVKKAESL
jgi:threonine 3-dehydrogenase